MRLPQFVQPYRHLIGPVFAPGLMMAVMSGIALPVLPLFLDSVGASYAVIGTVIAAQPLGKLLSALPSGGVLARFGIRTTMLIGCALTAVGILLLYTALALPLIYFSWLLTGIGLTIFELARHQVLAAHVAVGQRGRATALLGGVHRLGQALGPALGGVLAQQLGFSAAFLAMAGFAVLAGVVVLLLTPAAIGGQPVVAPPSGQNWQDLKTTALRNRRILAVAGGGQVLMQLVREARNILIPLVAANLVGLDVAAVGFVVSLGAAVDMTLFWPAGVIMDRYGRKATIVPSLTITGFGLIVLPLAGSFLAVASVSILFGLANGISSGAMMTLGADLAPPGERVPFLSIWRFFSALGFTAGGNVVGLVAQLLTLASAGTVTGSLGLFAALLFLRFVPETLQKQAEPLAE